MKNNPIHIVFSGGGTGGHLFPGLAVAGQLAEMIPGIRITFCGIGKTFERKFASQAGFDYFALPSRPLPHGPREAVAFVVENLAGYLAAKRFLQEEHVDAVVGLGGYTSVPMARAAARRRLPLVLLEQNAVPGKATRWLARWASLICSAFDPASWKHSLRCPIRVTGNPVRPGFLQGLKHSLQGLGTSAQDDSITLRGLGTSAQDDSITLRGLGTSAQDDSITLRGLGTSVPSEPLSKQLLILGGSGGARSLNENLPPALYKVRPQLEGWRIVHQCGEQGLEATQTLYRKLGLNAEVAPFLTDMPQILAATDLAVCRAGGTTLAELAVSGTPAVLIPFPKAADDHQLANARHYSAGGGCITIDQRELAVPMDDQLAETLCFLLANAELRGRMSAAMRELARPSAAEDVAELIWSVVSSRSCRSELAAA